MKNAYVVIATDKSAEYASGYEIVGIALNMAMAETMKEDFEEKNSGYFVDIRTYEIGKSYDINDCD